jgi:hypothetical protein
MQKYPFKGILPLFRRDIYQGGEYKNLIMGGKGLGPDKKVQLLMVLRNHPVYLAHLKIYGPGKGAGNAFSGPAIPAEICRTAASRGFVGMDTPEGLPGPQPIGITLWVSGQGAGFGIYKHNLSMTIKGHYRNRKIDKEVHAPVF